MRKPKYFSILSLTANIFIVWLVAISVFSFVSIGGTGFMKVKSSASFRYFTIDSNIFAGIASLIYIPYNIYCFVSGKENLPKWLQILKFCATVSVTVTFLTVMFFLGPIHGYASMFEGDQLYLHLIVPLLSFFTLSFAESEVTIKTAHSLYGIIPVFAYALLYYNKVIVRKEWNDFYGFNIGGRWYISFALMMIAALLICLLLRLLYNRLQSLMRRS